MFRLFIALAAVGLVSAAPPPPTAVAGCPNGGVGLGFTRLCPASGCTGLGYTSAVFNAGKCTVASHERTVGNSMTCTDNYTKDLTVECYNATTSYLIKSGTNNFTSCTYLAQEIQCGGTADWPNLIDQCCDGPIPSS